MGYDMSIKDEKRYIGDAVYVKFDGYHFVLTTEDGYSTTNKIAMEPQVVDEFYRYINDLKKELEG